MLNMDKRPCNECLLVLESYESFLNGAMLLADGRWRQ